MAEVFNVLTRVFNLFGVPFTAPVFICGDGFKKNRKDIVSAPKLFNWRSKNVNDLTHRDKLQGGPTLDPVTLWRHNVKARLRLEFCFHRITGNIDVFEQQWAH